MNKNRNSSITTHQYDNLEIAGKCIHGNDFELDKIIDLINTRVITRVVLEFHYDYRIDLSILHDTTDKSDPDTAEMNFRHRLASTPPNYGWENLKEYTIRPGEGNYCKMVAVGTDIQRVWLNFTLFARRQFVSVYDITSTITSHPRNEGCSGGFYSVYLPKFSRGTCLQSMEVEKLLYNIFAKACKDTIQHYHSGEISITASLGAYLNNYAKQAHGELTQAWEYSHLNRGFNFDIDFIDCQKKRDVGGADFAIELDVDIRNHHKRSSFAAFQAKKLSRNVFPFSKKDLDQLKRIQRFTHASYYVFYPTVVQAHLPSVVPARTLYSYLSARSTKSVSLVEIDAVGIGLADYFVYDLLPGWSGDERSPQSIHEFVINELQPVHILKVRISAFADENYPRSEEAR